MNGKILAGAAGIAAVVALIVAVVVLNVMAPPAPGPIGDDFFGQSYTTGIYREQGGDKLVAASGGEIEVQSGATLDVQSGATTDFSSGIDLGDAITLENDETIDNGTDGVVQVGGFTAFSEGAVVVVTAGSTITPTASFQPITSTAAVTNAVIADGSVAGQIVALSNENAADDITILESGSNLAAGGDIVLDGGNYDLAVLMWDGTRWIRWSFGDN